MPLKLRAELPSFEGVTEWINGTPDPGELRGLPVLVHFWANSCCACEDGLKVLHDWSRRFDERYGLRIVSFHMPRNEADRDPEAVKEVVRQHGLEHPVGIDSELAVTDVFRNGYVPAYYLFDRQGQMRFYGAGENALGMVEQRIHKLLGPAAEA